LIAEQTVDTDGYGLDLYMDDPYGYHDMTDDDGDGVWSVTLTLVENTTYNYKFKNGDEWEGNFNDLGCGAGDEYGNRTFTSDGADTILDPVCFNSCTDCEVETECVPGDADEDGFVNVLDVVAIVNGIVSGSDYYSECVDVNDDGAVNVMDVVAIVNIIVGPRSADATSATMNKEGNSLNISGNGYIGAVQMTLSHGADFSIDLTDNAMVAEYRTDGNTTRLMVVVPGSEEIFTASGEYNVDEVIVANSNTILSVETPSSFELGTAYPNPFNPSTNLNLHVPENGYVSVKAYNLVGQVVSVITEGNMEAGNSTITWDASSLSSGVYLITAEYAGNIVTQKVMLMK
jgi:hypothetical protein